MENYHFNWVKLYVSFFLFLLMWKWHPVLMKMPPLLCVSFFNKSKVSSCLLLFVFFCNLFKGSIAAVAQRKLTGCVILRLTKNALVLEHSGRFHDRKVHPSSWPAVLVHVSFILCAAVYIAASRKKKLKLECSGFYRCHYYQNNGCHLQQLSTQLKCDSQGLSHC